MYSSVSVDGFIADENDQPGPLFDWLTSGDIPLDGRLLKVSSEESRCETGVRGGDQIGVTIAGRRVFDDDERRDGTPPRRAGWCATAVVCVVRSDSRRGSGRRQGAVHVA